MVRFLRPCVKQYFCDGKSVTYKALGYPQDIGGCGLFDPVSCRVRLQAHHVPEHLVRLKAHPRGVKPSFALLRQVRVMSNYRRPRIPGATIFFTVALERRGADTLVRHVEALRVAVRRTMAERPFRIEAAVILPDHLHMIWTLPAGDSDFPNRWRMIKARFTHAGPNTRNLCKPYRAARSGIMATQVLGAPHSLGRGIGGAHAVLLGQPGQAWLGHGSVRLALFFHPPRRDARRGT